MYRFQLFAPTQIGESIAILGSSPELGSWDFSKCIHLQTNSDRYPLWWTEQAIDIPANFKIEYKYLRLEEKGDHQWEALGENRWIMPEKASDREDLKDLIVVDDGAFGYLQSYPFGYREKSALHLPEKLPQNSQNFLQKLFPKPQEKKSAGLKIVVIGSSVAAGHKAWMLEGWVSLLAKTLQQNYGHQLINVSEVGANTSSTIARFPVVVTPEKPDIVIIALSLGNEGFAPCAGQEQRKIQRHFESNLQQLIKMTRAIGAYPILGGVYPHNDYSSEHYRRLKATNNRLGHWDVPLLNWLPVLDNGQGHWKSGICFDPAHPNTLGHQLMYEAIAPEIFALSKNDLMQAKQSWLQGTSIFLDREGFQVSLEDKSLRMSNPSSYTYAIAPYWQELQNAVQSQAKLISGIYLTQKLQKDILPFFVVAEDGTLETLLTIPAGADLTYTPAFALLVTSNPDLVFHNGDLGILRGDDFLTEARPERGLWVINESDHEYNIQPMWQEVRQALKALPSGVYEEALNPDVPFRTMMIGKDGLESRVKVPPKSALFFQYKCQLSEISRVAILPLGDRCAVRMMLYKMGYDGPAFPFDLTRSTNISDVADAIENRFYDMWNPAFLQYNPEAGRIYHTKWSGLSFAHEVEETEDPVNDMAPIYERMRIRYSARSQRFWYTLRHCDKVLFVRTGLCDRSGVIDLVHKLTYRCQGKPFHLLILSPQSSEEFAHLPFVQHYDVDFNPDPMYENLEHWMYCTEIMRGILDSLGVSSKNLFWCPPVTPKDDTN